MGRAPCCDKDGLKKGPWLPEEDQKLIDYIQKHGAGNWRNLPKKAGLQRCGKSCRLRWTNYLRPDIKRGRFSFEEEETIIQLHSILGNKWSAIAAKLPGRTDNEIKNYWNTHIRKRLLRMGVDPVTHTRRLDLLNLPSILSSPLQNSSQFSLLKLLGLQSLMNPDLLKLATLLSTNQNENFNPLLQNLQSNNQLTSTGPMQNQFNPIVQTSNQIQTPVQNSMPTCTTTTSTLSPRVPVFVDTQVREPKLEQYPPNVSSFGTQNFGANQVSSLANDQWQSNELVQDYDHNVQDQAILDCLFDELNFQSNNSNQRMNFSSVFSTPCSSQQTPLSSNSQCVNNNSSSSSEDEIDSYCDSLMNFDIPVDLFNVCNS